MAQLRSQAMTIGQLSQRTGVSIKTLREYERLGFLYTQGRSESNYRLFGEDALWCVQVVQSLRSLGLTLTAIQDIAANYREHPGEQINILLDEYLVRADARIAAQIADLQALRQRIHDFQAIRANEHTNTQTPPSELLGLFASDPRGNAVNSAS